MRRAVIALFVVTGTLVLPAAGWAASGTGTNPLAPGIPQAPVPTPTTTTTPPIVNTTTTSSSSDSGLSGSNAVLIGVGALVLLGGISFFIWRDARRRAPVRARAAAATADGFGGGRAGSKARGKPRKLSPAERRRRKRGRAR